jgi:PAS domain S-box-containing protein
MSAIPTTPSDAVLQAPGERRDADDAHRVLADQVALLFRQAPIGVGGALLVAALVVYELYDPGSRELVIFWAFVALLVAASRFVLVRGYRADTRRDQEPERWLRWFSIGALAEGVSWGFAAAVFFPSISDEQRVFLAFVLATMTAGGLPLFSAVWWVFALFAFGVIVPFEAALFTYGRRLFSELALMIPILLAINVAVAYRLNQVFVSGYRLRQSYGRLTHDYTALNYQLGQRLAELEEARRQVEASGRKLALFAECSPIPVFEFDWNGVVLSANPAAENLFGYSAAEMIGRKGTEFLFPREVHADVLTKWSGIMRSGKPVVALRYHNVRRDGAELVCEWSITPLVSPGNRVISVIVQGRDITQQLEAERMKQEFTSTLSHELRTPLTSILGSLQLINSGMFGDLDKDVAELAQVAERNGQRLLDLINDILDIEKIESGKLTLFPEPMPLDTLLHEAVKLNQAFAKRFNVKVALSADLPAVVVNVDVKRILQVMTNLISNAAKFSPAGETVTIEMHDLGGEVRVAVNDRGTGIPENFRGRIFARFAQADSTDTRQKGGTGLGLAICKRLIELMGGRVGFADRQGGGTMFFFELPKHHPH